MSTLPHGPTCSCSDCRLLWLEFWKRVINSPLNFNYAEMATIPRAATLLMSGSPKDLHKVLIAAILHSEEELLVVTDEELRKAEQYSLITTVVEEEKTVVLTVRPK